jgi:hypothetical protein
VNITDSFSASLGYAFGFRNSITGPVREATGFGVSFDSQIQMITFGMQFRFGGGSRRKCVTPVDCCEPAAAPVASNPGDPVRVAGGAHTHPGG